MSRPEKFANPWADNGGDVTPDFTTAKRDVGFVGGDIPAIEDFNILNREEQLMLNSIITEGPGSWYPEAADVNRMIVSGQWDEPWGLTDSAINTMGDSLAASEYVDICPHFNSDNDPRILILEAGTPEIQVWDARTRTLIQTTNALTDDLPAATGAWTPVSMCSDNTYVYVTFTDVHAGADNHQIQAWTIDETAADWAVKTGWAATGTALTGTGNGLDAGSRDSKVIIADDDYLAVSCGWVAAAAAGSACIQLYDITDGTLTRDGAGDCATVAMQPIEGICSDGTNIFYLAFDGADCDICSAQIADLTAGAAGAANYPKTITTGIDAYGRHMVCLGVGGPWVAALDYDGGGGATDVVLYVGDAADADYMEIERGDMLCGEEGEDYIWFSVYDLTFDGMNLWALTHANDGAVDTLKLIKIDAAKLATIVQADNPWLMDLTKSVFQMLPADNFPISAHASRKFVSMCFDGRDIWVNPEPRASATQSGEVFRLPMALLRH